MSNQHNEVVEYIRNSVDTANTYIADFANTLVSDPSHALAWSKNTFMYAAESEVRSRVLKQLDRMLQDGWTIGTAFSAVKNRLLADILNSASYPESSTSQADNMMNRYRLAVMADTYRQLDSAR